MDEVCNAFQNNYHSGWAYMVSYAQHLFQLQHDTQHIIAGQRCRLGSYAKEVKSLSQEISHMAQEYGVMRQQVRDLELSTIYRCPIERDQEVLQHHDLLREVEEATAAKARELEELQAAKTQEITHLQGELQECEEELQEHEIELANQDNEIDNFQAQIHQLQLQQAPAPAYT
jgi:DNA repair exonuclease SbcCD ATPase subunit